MLKVIDIYNYTLRYSNVLLKIGEILFRMVLNKMSSVAYNLFILRIIRKC